MSVMKAISIGMQFVIGIAFAIVAFGALLKLAVVTIGWSYR